MIKLVFCASRKNELSLSDFRNSWQESHVPLLARFAEATSAVKYVNSLTLAVERNLELMLTQGTRPPYDAVSEIWWSSAAQLQEVLDSAEAQSVRNQLFSQGSQYIDHARSTLFYTQED